MTLAMQSSLDEMPFGIEIEFDADKSFPFDTLGRDLYEAGLTNNPLLMGYHANSIDNLYAHHRGWRYEEEHSTTGAGVISPCVLSTEETWGNVQKVLDLIKSYGGHSKTTDSGLHVHVNASVLGKELDKWRNLFRFLIHYEDVLFRLAADPARGSHRRTHHTKPLPVDNPNPKHILPYLLTFSKKDFFVNTHHVKPLQETGRVEFKIWDATLDSKLIHLHTKLSLAIMRLASRTDIPFLGNIARRGHHFTSKTEFPSSLLTELLDALFPDEPELHSLATDIFYQNNWAEPYTPKNARKIKSGG